MKRTHSGTFPSPAPAATPGVHLGADQTFVDPNADTDAGRPALRNRPPVEAPPGFDPTATSAGSARLANTAVLSTANSISVGDPVTAPATATVSALANPGLAACAAAQPLLKLWDICARSNTPIPDLSGISEADQLNQLMKAVREKDLGRIAALILAGVPLRPHDASGLSVYQSPKKRGQVDKLYGPTFPLAKAIRSGSMDVVEVLCLHPSIEREKQDAGYLVHVFIKKAPAAAQERMVRKLLDHGFALEPQGQFPIFDGLLANILDPDGNFYKDEQVVALLLSLGANPNIWVRGESIIDYLDAQIAGQRSQNNPDEKLINKLQVISQLLTKAGCTVGNLTAMQEACFALDFPLLEKQIRHDVRAHHQNSGFPQTVEALELIPDALHPIAQDLLNNPQAPKFDFELLTYRPKSTEKTSWLYETSSHVERHLLTIEHFRKQDFCSGFKLTLLNLLGTNYQLLRAISFDEHPPTEQQSKQCMFHLVQGFIDDPVLHSKAMAAYKDAGLSELTQKNFAVIIKNQAQSFISYLRQYVTTIPEIPVLDSIFDDFLGYCCRLQTASESHMSRDALTELRSALVSAGMFGPMVVRILTAWESVSRRHANGLPAIDAEGKINGTPLLDTEIGEKLANQFGQALLAQFTTDKGSVLVPPEGSGVDKDAFAVVMQPQYELVTGYARGAAEFRRAS